MDMGSKIANITAMPPTRMVGSALSSHSSIYNIKKKQYRNLTTFFMRKIFAFIKIHDIIMTALKM